VTVGYGLGITDISGSLGHNGGIFGNTSVMFDLPSRQGTVLLPETNSTLFTPVTLTTFFELAAYLSRVSSRAAHPPQP
jgi:hypothetical protein